MNTTETTTSDDVPEGDSSEPPQPRLAEGSSAGKDGVGLQLIDRTRRLDPSALAFLRDAMLKLLQEMGATCDRCTIEIVDDARMTLLHGRWKDDPTTTDVLTFPMSAPGEPIDADIAVCLDEAQRRSDARDHDHVHELLLYALHGVLHVNGHSDDDAESYERMHAEEDRLLDRTGIGALFSTPDATEEAEG